MLLLAKQSGQRSSEFDFPNVIADAAHRGRQLHLDRLGERRDFAA